MRSPPYLLLLLLKVRLLLVLQVRLLLQFLAIRLWGLLEELLGLLGWLLLLSKGWRSRGWDRVLGLGQGVAVATVQGLDRKGVVIGVVIVVVDVLIIVSCMRLVIIIIRSRLAVELMVNLMLMVLVVILVLVLVLIKALLLLLLRWWLLVVGVLRQRKY